MNQNYNTLVDAISTLYREPSYDPAAAVESLLQTGVDPNACTEDGITALHYLASGDNPNVEVGRVLLRYGADVNARFVDPDLGVEVRAGEGFTPLMDAAEHNSTELMRLFLDHGAEIDTRGEYGSALVCAAMIGSRDAVRLLLERGASVYATDGKGWTALDHAKFEGFEKIVQIPRDAGARDVPVPETGGE